ncbi:fimbrial protein [Enterobacter mori]
MKPLRLIRVNLFLFLLSVGYVSPTVAVNKTVDMKLTVLINGAPPCSISGGTVEFGTMMIGSVDGSNYAKPVNYSLNCSGRVSDYLRLQIQGSSITVNNESVLKTNINNLGIRLQTTSDKKLLPIGTANWLDFKYSSSSGPALQAIPVKVNGTTLQTGEFSASATMVVEYQ